MKHNMMMKTAILCSALIFAAVTSPAEPEGSEFIGTWRLVRGVAGDGVPQELVITANGKQYLVKSPGELPAGAVYKDGMLVISGVINLTYIRDSGRLILGFGSGGEYQRQNSALPKTDSSIREKARPGAGPPRASSTFRSIEDARVAFERAIQAEDKRVNSFDEATRRKLRPLIVKANTDFRKNRYAETVKSCESACAIDPENHWAHFLAGASYEQLNQLDEAEKHLSKAIQLIPSNDKSHFRMFLIHAKKGQNDAALASLETAINCGYTNWFELPTADEVPSAIKEMPKFKQLTAKK